MVHISSTFHDNWVGTFAHTRKVQFYRRPDHTPGTRKPHAVLTEPHPKPLSHSLPTSEHLWSWRTNLRQLLLPHIRLKSVIRNYSVSFCQKYSSYSIFLNLYPPPFNTFACEFFRFHGVISRPILQPFAASINIAKVIYIYSS